jgi:trans-aconitate methyltransferase
LPRVQKRTCAGRGLEDHRPDRSYDIIIFNEVLYYLVVENAVREFHRYAAYLEAGGLIAVSMKHDPKAGSIMRAIAAEVTWVSGLLTQEKMDGPGWRIRMDAARPAYLIGIFRPD